ncbi:unnamed protein product [Notodromas monacha]|uniref:Uncharacterized protein n=1 Tax=Notodromas monacha TaxID=399045 RepID=A0A7R9BSP2_9CRUS|nr:unnamed protein product [Notodromas monacha]CAG0921008.1 unnamed protein product [Notodromas monacha]
MESSATPVGNHSGRVEKKGATSMGKDATGNSGMEKNEMNFYGHESSDERLLLDESPSQGKDAMGNSGMEKNEMNSYGHESSDERLLLDESTSQGSESIGDTHSDDESDISFNLDDSFDDLVMVYDLVASSGDYEFERRFVTREEYEETYGNGWKDSSSSVHENETQSNEDESPENTSSFEGYAKKSKGNESKGDMPLDVENDTNSNDNDSGIECSVLLYDILESPGNLSKLGENETTSIGSGSPEISQSDAEHETKSSGFETTEDPSPVKQLHAESNGGKISKEETPSKVEYIHILKHLASARTPRQSIQRLEMLWGQKINSENSCLTFFSTPVEHVNKKRKLIVNSHWILPLSMYSACNKMLSHVLPVLRLHLKSCRETSMFQDKSRQVMAKKDQIWARFRSVEAQIYHSPYLKPWEKDSHRQDAVQRMNEEIKRVSLPNDGIGEQNRLDKLWEKYWSECKDWSLLNPNMEAGLLPVEQFLSNDRAAMLAENFGILYKATR